MPKKIAFQSDGVIADVLLIGDRLPADAGVLNAADLPIRVTRVDDASQALATLECGTLLPALIVVAQSRPEQISAADINRLRIAAPLTPICGLLGSWCEGEMRSGKPWPGTTRCYWHQWPARFEQETAAMAARRSSMWSLPLTTSAEEQLLSTVPLLPPQRQDRLLAIVAESSETAATLADSAQMRGYRTVVLRSVRGVQVSGALATLWDVRPEVVESSAAVQEVLAAVRDAPLIALLSFPREEIVSLAKALGVSAVISKPMLLNDLFWQVEQLAGTSFPAERNRL